MSKSFSIELSMSNLYLFGSAHFTCLDTPTWKYWWLQCHDYNPITWLTIYHQALGREQDHPNKVRLQDDSWLGWSKPKRILNQSVDNKERKLAQINSISSSKIFQALEDLQKMMALAENGGWRWKWPWLVC